MGGFSGIGFCGKMDYFGAKLVQIEHFMKFKSIMGID